MIRELKMTVEQRLRWRRFGLHGGASVEQVPLHEVRLSECREAKLDVDSGDVVEIKIGKAWRWAIVWKDRMGVPA